MAMVVTFITESARICVTSTWPSPSCCHHATTAMPRTRAAAAKAPKTDNTDLPAGTRVEVHCDKGTADEYKVKGTVVEYNHMAAVLATWCYLVKPDDGSPPFLALAEAIRPLPCFFRFDLLPDDLLPMVVRDRGRHGQAAHVLAAEHAAERDRRDADLARRVGGRVDGESWRAGQLTRSRFEAGGDCSIEKASRTTRRHRVDGWQGLAAQAGRGAHAELVFAAPLAAAVRDGSDPDPAVVKRPKGSTQVLCEASAAASRCRSPPLVHQPDRRIRPGDEHPVWQARWRECRRQLCHRRPRHGRASRRRYLSRRRGLQGLLQGREHGQQENAHWDRTSCASEARPPTRRLPPLIQVAGLGTTAVRDGDPRGQQPGEWEVRGHTVQAAAHGARDLE